MLELTQAPGKPAGTGPWKKKGPVAPAKPSKKGTPTH